VKLKNIPQPTLKKPAVSKPAVVSVASPVLSKVAQKKETQKQVLASTTAQKTVMRGRAKKEVENEAASPQNGANLEEDNEVRIESEGQETSEIQFDPKLSETQFGASTMDFSKPDGDSKDANTVQFEEPSAEKQPRDAESLNGVESLKESQQDLNTEENHQEENDISQSMQAMQAKNLDKVKKDAPFSSKIKTPSQISNGSKSTAATSKPSLKSQVGSLGKTGQSLKSGITSKKS